MEVTEGHLLNRRLRHIQPRQGHRTGLEPVLLAAAVPARPGERVLEGGTGSGAGLLCLAARVPDLRGVGLERCPATAALARANAEANGFDQLSVLAGDLAELRPEGVFDHAFANPPWHGTGTASPDSAREAAKRAAPGLFGLWAARLAAPLRPRGTLTLVVAAAALPACLQALAVAGCGSASVFPLWPKAGREAKLMLLRGIKGGRAPCRLLPGLVLHESDGRFTAAAEAVLRDGMALAF
ncbi:Methyltransferase [Rhodovastum atsumiense]|uniref:Methyltransferase n=1 Tax=Rhodovastum atsumiense TaxID=504468 RepID=A0A5M6J291_9PROT|nr:methyltransferase [Rhodovastum atsumiense]KAA5614614.1 methyltransferase [Rhodovastum atsumiense]CAH2599877.1 Methyltransferase [Rhodovastum atsumiense]